MPLPRTSSRNPAPDYPAVSAGMLEAVFTNAVQETMAPAAEQWVNSHHTELVNTLKPLIRSWMDERLPQVVESILRQELGRAIGKSSASLILRVGHSDDTGVRIAGAGADGGNRTRVCSLGSCRSTIELRPLFPDLSLFCLLKTRLFLTAEANFVQIAFDLVRPKSTISTAVASAASRADSPGARNPQRGTPI